MGWAGYKIYDGDGTQTCHITFMERAGYRFDDENFEFDEIMASGKTILTPEMKKMLRQNIAKVLSKMPKVIKSEFTGRQYFASEDDAIEWQMLLALYIDNNMKPSKQIKDLGILATEHLMYSCSDNFNEPHARRRELKAFIKKVIAKK